MISKLKIDEASICSGVSVEVALGSTEFWEKRKNLQRVNDVLECVNVINNTKLFESTLSEMVYLNDIK